MTRIGQSLLLFVNCANSTSDAAWDLTFIQHNGTNIRGSFQVTTTPALPIPSPVANRAAISGFFDSVPTDPLSVSVSKAYVGAGRVWSVIVHSVLWNRPATADTISTRSGCGSVTIQQVQVVVFPTAQRVEAVTNGQYLSGVIKVG